VVLRQNFTAAQYDPFHAGAALLLCPLPKLRAIQKSIFLNNTNRVCCRWRRAWFSKRSCADGALDSITHEEETRHLTSSESNPRFNKALEILQQRFMLLPTGIAERAPGAIPLFTI
jgi:hypothetical protein